MSTPFLSELPIPVSVAPDKLADIQAEFSRDWSQLLSDAQKGTLGSPADRRFRGEAWSSSPDSLLRAHAYLLTAGVMNKMVDAVQAPESMRTRLRFAVMQWVDAVSPSNYLATNPQAQHAMLQSNGLSLQHGLSNLMSDLQKGRLSQTDESKYVLGENVGITPGAVVFENPLMQLIQYAPLTPKVYAKPLLIVPPCINKFYILDLQPENSFVRHAVEQGFTVYLVSWRNPLESDTDDSQSSTWDDYLTHGVLKAIDIVCDISGQSQINALGFCVGGTLLSSALALERAKGKDPVSSLTLLTTLLDFTDTGILNVFVDEGHAQMRERQMANGGLLSAGELGTTFSFLRPNELVWNYVVSNYLKGESPPAFDLLHWNSDGTNLPGPFFTWYFRNTYLENNLKVPGRVKVDGLPIDLGTLDMPAYIYGSREDHIVPWQSAYASTALVRGTVRFVLGASGHIAGVINPPAKKSRSYWAGLPSYQPCEIPGDPDAWLGQATEHQGSWWPDWTQWLASQSGDQKRSGKKLGNARHRPIEAAPGRYVKVRVV